MFGVEKNSHSIKQIDIMPSKYVAIANRIDKYTHKKQRPMSQTEHDSLFFRYSVNLWCCWSILFRCQLLDWYLMLRGKKCAAAMHDVYVIMNSIFYWCCWMPPDYHALQIMCENFNLNHKYARNIPMIYWSLSVNRWDPEIMFVLTFDRMRIVKRL